MSGDLISRTEAIKRLKEDIKKCENALKNKTHQSVKEELRWAIYFDDLYIECLKNMPTVEQKHGHWIVIEQDVTGLKRYECSNCGKTDDDYSEPIFCKHCGYANGRTGKMNEVTK